MAYSLGGGIVSRVVVVSALFAFILISPVSWADDIEDGKNIFNGPAGCQSCHKITDKKSVGTGLAGNAGIHTDAWLLKWLNDPQTTWEENDRETQDLRKRVGKPNEPRTAMKKRKILAEGDLRALIAYLKSL